MQWHTKGDLPHNLNYIITLQCVILMVLIANFFLDRHLVHLEEGLKNRSNALLASLQETLDAKKEVSPSPLINISKLRDHIEKQYSLLLMLTKTLQSNNVTFAFCIGSINIITIYLSLRCKKCGGAK